jgi:hypothetical protein
MSEPEPPPPDLQDAQPREVPAPPAASSHSAAPPPHPLAPPEVHALLETIGRALAPDADDGMRAQARELWTRCVSELTAGGAPAHAQPLPPSGPSGLPTPVAAPPHAGGTYAPPAMPPITAAVQAVKQMSPDQLLDIALQRLRASLPAGVNVAVPRGIQFNLVPIPPIPSKTK